MGVIGVQGGDINGDKQDIGEKELRMVGKNSHMRP